MVRGLALALGLAGLLGAMPAAADGYRIETLAEGLDHPWSLAFIDADTILVTERAGRLRVIEHGRLREAPIGGVPAAYVEGQAGLFDVLLDADFADNRQIYLSFAAGEPRANQTRIVAARLEADRLHDVRTIFSAYPPKTGAAHYGGRMVQLADGTLVAGLGDGFVYREWAQRLDSHIGSVIRINTDGSVPEDNPLVGRDGALPEIYSWGHRNVQGLVFDPVAERLIAHEHGPRGGDELNLIQPGHNYGWPLLTAGIDYNFARITPFDDYPGMTPALHGWTPSIAPAGMTLYTGTMFPEWRGSLLVSGLASRRVHRLGFDDAGGVVEHSSLFEELDVRIRDVRMGPEGALYLLVDEAAPHGRVLRVSREAGPGLNAEQQR